MLVVERQGENMKCTSENVKNRLICIIFIFIDRWYITLPIVLSALFVFFCGDAVYEVVPHDMNVTKWDEFITEVDENITISSSYKLLILMTLQIFHNFLGLPMGNITKIFYGYWFGWLWGTLICAAFEMLLLYLYVKTIKIKEMDIIFSIIHAIREKGMLWIELIILAASSVPLQVAGLLIEFGGVSCMEYLFTHFIVTFIMTLKNCVCGYLISDSISNRNLLIFSIIMVSGSVVPTFSAIYVSTRMLFTCIKLIKEKKKTDQEELERIIAYDDISLEGLQCDSCKEEEEGLADMEISDHETGSLDKSPRGTE